MEPTPMEQLSNSFWNAYQYIVDISSNVVPASNVIPPDPIMDDIDYGPDNPLRSKNIDSGYEIISIDNNDDIENNNENVEDDCPICLESIKSSPHIGLICYGNGTLKHKFHEECMVCTLNALPSYHTTFECPLCRCRHNYQIPFHDLRSVNFKTYWYYKSVHLMSPVDKFMMMVGWIVFVYYTHQMIQSKIINQFGSIDYLSHNTWKVYGLFYFGSAVVINMFEIACCFTLFVNEKHAFYVMNTPFALSVGHIISLTIYYCINKYIVVNKNQTIFMLLSFPLIVTINYFIMVMLIIYVYMHHDKYRENYNKFIQKIANKLFYKYRKNKKKSLAFNIRIWNDHQDVEIRN